MFDLPTNTPNSVVIETAAILEKKSGQKRNGNEIYE